MHVFEVLSDPVRRRILELLGPGEMASGEVVEAIGSEFGCHAGGGVAAPEGAARAALQRSVRRHSDNSSVDAAGLRQMDAWIGEFRNFWEPKLDALATEIARGEHGRRNAPVSKRTGEWACSRSRGQRRVPGALFPHIAEPVIGRAFARPVHSCGLLSAGEDCNGR